jgi:hypothetical protein
VQAPSRIRLEFAADGGGLVVFGCLEGEALGAFFVGGGVPPPIFHFLEATRLFCAFYGWWLLSNVGKQRTYG